MSVLIYDERWDEVAAPDSFRELRQQSRTQIPVNSLCTLVGVESLSQQISGQVSNSNQIIAFGGGGVLDKVKLAVLNAQTPIRPYVTRGRAGVVIIPHQCETLVTLIPTTLGTGSEANTKAVLEVAPERRRLVLFQEQSSFAYLHWPDVYTFLNNRQVNHGILEIFFRCVGSFVVTSEDSAEIFLEYFAAAAQYLRETANRSGTQPDAGYLANIATLSALTHQTPITATTRAGLLWVWPLWYLANELASIAKVTKMEATIALADSVISRVGKIGYGTRDAVNQLSAVLGESLSDFIAHFALKLDDKVAVCLAAAPLDRLITQTLSQWAGGRLPLGLASREQVAEIYREVKNAYA